MPTFHFYVPTCQKTCHRAIRRASVPKGMPIFQTFLLGESNVTFCCMGPTDPNFRQIKIIIILISHINIYFFTIYNSSNWFFLDYNKIHKKQKFSAFDIVESRSKGMRSVSYVTCMDICTSFFNSTFGIFIFRCVNPYY